MERTPAQFNQSFFRAPEDLLLPASEPLTPREEQTVRLAKSGLPDEEIARQMGLAKQTVKNRLTTVRMRIAINRRKAKFEALRQYDGLTSHQKDILDFLIIDGSYKHAGKAFNISPLTVAKTLQKIRKQMRVNASIAA